VIESTSLFPKPDSPSPSIDRIAKQNFTGGVAPTGSESTTQVLKDSPTKNPIQPFTLKR